MIKSFKLLYTLRNFDLSIMNHKSLIHPKTGLDAINTDLTIKFLNEIKISLENQYLQEGYLIYVDLINFIDKVLEPATELKNLIASDSTNTSDIKIKRKIVNRLLCDLVKVNSNIISKIELNLGIDHNCIKLKKMI